ncbi:MAG: acyl carrier protein [Candidatus Binatia bacterium]
MADDRAALLADFIRQKLLPDDDRPVGPDTRLLTEGLIDSMGAVMLAAFIEERFGVRFDDSELRAEQLETIREILRVVDRRR